MKKQLLSLAGLALATTGMMAQVTAPTIYPGKILTHISKNGEWAINNDNITLMAVEVINLRTGETYTYAPADGSEDYDIGSGNCISNDGILVMSRNYDGTASYAIDGKIYDLPVPDEYQSAYSNGITADGTRICGTVGMSMNIDAQDVMQKPCYWDRKSDGTWDGPKLLPYPKTDWAGQIPQYLLTSWISNDGKTIAGQLHDGMGSVDQPIVYRQDDKGEWSYELIHPELINPNNIQVPAFPGDGPSTPDPKDFMTADEYTAYQTALDNWDWQSGDPYPNAEDYMTDDEKAKYAVAVDAYNKEAEEYNTKLMEYFDAVEQAIQDSKLFGMNCVTLSGNGRYYGTAHQIIDFWNPEGNASDPWIFDLETGDKFEYHTDGLNLSPTWINDNGLMLASTPVNDYSRDAYILNGVWSKFVPFSDYVKERNQSLYNWMNDNMRHDVITWSYEENPETGEYEEVANTEKDKWLTGTPYANEDLSVITSWTANNWDEFDENYFYSYILVSDKLDAIEGVDVDNNTLSLSVDHQGVVTVTGDAKSLNIYDVNGRQVYSVDAPTGDVNTGLSSGIYMLKLEGKSGAVKVLKAVI